MDVDGFSYAQQLEWAIRHLTAAGRDPARLEELPWPWFELQEDFAVITDVGARWLTRAAGHLAQRLETMLRADPVAPEVAANPMPLQTCPGSLQHPKERGYNQDAALLGQCAVCLRWLTIAPGDLIPAHLERRSAWGDRRSFMERRQRERP